MTISRLDKVRAGRLKEPLRCLFYGAEGVGKSTLAAHSHRPVVLDLERGTSHLDVARYPVDESYQGVLFALDDLIHNEHDYETLVIDTVDSLEGLIWAHICERDKKSSIEDYGYGKGYMHAQTEWRVVLSKLERLRSSKGMIIILLGHSETKLYKNPEGDDFDRYQLRVNTKAGGLLKDWCDIVGHIYFEQHAHTDESGRTRGHATGRRLLGLSRTATSDAKTRLVLPPRIELEVADPWSPFWSLVQAGRDIDVAAVLKDIDAELRRLGDEDLTKKVEAAVERAKKDPVALTRYLHKLREKEAT